MKRLRNRKRRGHMVVESTLVLLVVIVMIIGIFDFGQFLFFHQALVERVRSGVRYGTVNAYDAEAIKNVVVYGQSTVPEGAAGFLGLTTQMVAVERTDPSSDGDRVTVTITGYPIRYFSPFMAKVSTSLPITASLPYEY